MMERIRKMPRWAVLIVCVVGIVALWIGVFRLLKPHSLPNFDRFGHAWECQRNLIYLIGAKGNVARELKKPDGSNITLDELVTYESTGSPSRLQLNCPKTGEKYIIGPIGKLPVCPSGLKGHEVPADWRHLSR